MYFQYSWNKLRVLKHTNNKIVFGKNPMRKQRGTVLVFVTLTLITIFSFAALAIDVGYLFVVRNELQNAADSAALAGANYLYGDLYKKNPLAKTVCLQTNVTFPNFNCAKLMADEAVTLNKATNTALINYHDASIGYWNVTGSPTGLQSTSITPGTNNRPAVKVIISKSNGQNGGGIDTVFARILGINTLDVSATAVAVGGLSPGSTTSSLMPFIIPSCLYSSLYWNSSTNEPTTPPTTFSLGSTIFYSGCGSTIETEWTTFNTGKTGVPEVRRLIQSATATPPTTIPQLAIGTVIDTKAGNDSNLYSTPHQTSINGCSEAGDKSCAYAMVPVVNTVCVTGGVGCNSSEPITGFACIHIMSAVGASPGPGTPNSIINIQLLAMGSVPQCEIPNSGGTGPNYGAYIPPKLVNYSGNTY